MTLSLTGYMTLDKSHYTILYLSFFFLWKSVIKLEVSQAFSYLFHLPEAHRPGERKALESKFALDSGSKEWII